MCNGLLWYLHVEKWQSGVRESIFPSLHCEMSERANSWAHCKATEIPSIRLSRHRVRRFRRCSSSVNGSNASRVFMVCVQNQGCGAVKWSTVPWCCQKHPGLISICFWVVYCDTHPQLCFAAVKSQGNAYMNRDELFQLDLTAHLVGLLLGSTSPYVANADDMTAFREGLRTWSQLPVFCLHAHTAVQIEMCPYSLILLRFIKNK